MGKAIITFIVVAAVLAVLFYVGRKKENSSIICTHNCSSCPNRGTCTEEVKNMR